MFNYAFYAASRQPSRRAASAGPSTLVRVLNSLAEAFDHRVDGERVESWRTPPF
jgi:hypothetical protein